MIDGHIHMVLDGADWRRSIGRHSGGVDSAAVERCLQRYRDLGFTYLRDGGDRWGVGAAARRIAASYGITYRTPGSPIYKKGHYGGLLGTGFDTLSEYTRLVVQTRESGGDFIKIMISGLMDFDRFGVLTEEGLAPAEIGQMVHIAHAEGMAVMAHANGTAALAAAEAGVDSIEHGAYLTPAALEAMADNAVIWVPTLSTVGNLRGKGRFDEYAVSKILDSAMENVAAFAAMGGLLAPGTDAGAWAVPHGSTTEYALLGQIFGNQLDSAMKAGIDRLLLKF